MGIFFDDGGGLNAQDNSTVDEQDLLWNPDSSTTGTSSSCIAVNNFLTTIPCSDQTQYLCELAETGSLLIHEFVCFSLS